ARPRGWPPRRGAPPPGPPRRGASPTLYRSPGGSLQRRAFSLALRFPRQLLPIVRAEEALPKTNRPGRHLDQLIVLDILQGAFERQLPRRLELNVLIARLRAHVRQLLLLRRI